LIGALRALACRCAGGRSGRAHALLEDAHDVDHVGRLFIVLSSPLFDLDDVTVFVALLLGEREQSVRVVVSERFAVEVICLELSESNLDRVVVRSRLPCARQADRVWCTELVAEPHRGRAQQSALREDRGEIFLAAHDERCDARTPRPLHRVREQPIGLRRVSRGREHIGPLEQLRRDLVAAHEALQVDVARLARRERVELVVRDDREAAIGPLVPAHDLVVRERLLVDGAVEAAL